MDVTALIPLEGCEQPIVAVRLPDGRVGATLRSLCAAFFLEISGQRQRIQRTASLKVALLPVILDTDGGRQSMDVLLDWCVPIWLGGVNIKHLPPATQPIVLDFQQRAVFLLEHAFDTRREAPTELDQTSLHQVRQALLLAAEGITNFEVEHRALVERVTMLEGGPARPIVGVSPQRLAHLYLLAHRVRQRYDHPIAETLKGLADRFRVEDVYDLPEKDWPAALEWFSTILED